MVDAHITDSITSTFGRLARAADDTVIGITPADLIVDASNTSTIDSEVIAISAAISGAAFAGAGSIGVALAENRVGDASAVSGSNSHGTYASIEDSQVTSSGDLQVHATSSETVSTVSAAGSVAAAIGIGGAAAASGTSSVSSMSGDTHAWVEDSSVDAAGDLEIEAVSNSVVTEATAVGAALAASGGVSVTIAVTLVENEIKNDVQAWVAGDATHHVASFGNMTILADAADQRIDNVTGVTASVSGGVTGASGGGLELDNTIHNRIDANVHGAINVNAIGNLIVKANEKALIDADASNVTVAVSLGAALGVSLVDNTIASTVNALVQDATVLAANISVLAITDDEIAKTTSVGVSASFVGATGNASTATIQNLVQAQAVNADLTAEQDVTIQAYADHFARAAANGGAFGAIAAGGMTADIVQGGLASGGVDIPEVFALIGTGTKIHATGITLNAQSTDDLLATSVAAAGGLIAGAGAGSSVDSDQSATAQVGSNAELHANAITIVAYANQNGDSAADSYTLGAATGAGASTSNRTVGDTTINIGTGATLSANSLTLGSSNIAMKDGPVGSNNIRSGSVAGGALAIVLSDTKLGSSSNPLGSYINVMPGATLEVGGTNAILVSSTSKPRQKQTPSIAFDWRPHPATRQRTLIPRSAAIPMQTWC